MRVRRVSTHLLHHVVTAALLMAGLSGLAMSSAPSSAAATVVPICSYGQLEVAAVVPNGADYATGNVGIPFIIVNVGDSACKLVGYPKLHLSPSTYKKSIVKVENGGGMIFRSVKPQTVIIKPGADASFGLDFGDAYDQQDPSGTPCMTQSATVSLPFRSQPYAMGFDTNVTFNFCFAGFRVFVTSIEAGPVPRRG